MQEYTLRQREEEEKFERCLEKGREWLESGGEQKELEKWLNVFEGRSVVGTFPSSMDL